MQIATPAYLKILSIRDVQRWLAEESIASCTDADLQRIREAAAVLARPKPKREDVQPIQNKWQVAQKKNSKSRPLEDVIHEFRGKVVEAAQKLQVEFANNAEKLVARSMDTSDAVDSNDEPWLAELKARQKKELKIALLKNTWNSSKNGHMQNPKSRANKRNGLQAQVLRILSNLTQRNKLDTLHQSYLQKTQRILQTLTHQAKAVL